MPGLIAIIVLLVFFGVLIKLIPKDTQSVATEPERKMTQTEILEAWRAKDFVRWISRGVYIATAMELFFEDGWAGHIMLTTNNTYLWFDTSEANHLKYGTITNQAHALEIHKNELMIDKSLESKGVKV
jgi:hypothetical protein